MNEIRPGRIDTVERLRELIPLPGRIVGAKIQDRLDSQALAFVKRSPFLLMATQSEAGFELSPKGDDPGFVAAPDAQTLLIPERKGNQLALGLQNLLSDDRIGLVFFRPATSELLRVRGRAELLDDTALCASLPARGEPAILVVKVYVQQSFFHCVRSIKRARLWEPESWGEPTRISFGRIYSEALQQKDLEAFIEAQQETFNEDL